MHVGIAKSWWRGKQSRHSRRMRNPQFYVSGKRPLARLIWYWNVSYFLKHMLNIWLHRYASTCLKPWLFAIGERLSMPLQLRQMNVMASQLTGNYVVCGKMCFSQHQRKHQSSILFTFCPDWGGGGGGGGSIEFYIFNKLGLRWFQQSQIIDR